MNWELEGRRALVTGGSTGIGRAIALGLASCGASATVNYSRSNQDAEDVVARIKQQGGRARAIQTDVTDEDQVARMISSEVEASGGIDILVANAGGPGKTAPTVKLTSADWDECLNLNCKAVFFCVKHALPHLPDGRGRIIVTSSISARTGAGPEMLAYAAAKGALNNMVRSWAKELAPRRITVNAIAPGIIRTRLHERTTSPKDYRRLIERIPLGRDGLPEDCVGTVLLLASDAGSYITGQVIEINGGMLMP